MATSEGMARSKNLQQPGHQAVQRTANFPSRTAIDFNGDLLIANQAPAGQSSVTKIAIDAESCIDRNRDGKIQTSADTSGDGWIDTDCNHDGMQDDLASVRARPCVNGLAQEFYGQDDECILWTSNTFLPDALGRSLGLGQGATDANASDAWAGSFATGTFVRIDGTTGLDKATSQLPDECHANGTGPNGVAIDAQGIAWAPDRGPGRLCY